MKKTIPISIAQTLFYIEEDSYAKLDNYLAEIKKYFSTYEDKFEIIQDIESRIREQLLEFSDADKTERIITGAHIDKLIENMGWPKEFGGFENEASKAEAQTTTRNNKRLYRNRNNALIGGVASGLASYLGIHSTIIRTVFFVSIFFGGLGIIIYLILWFALPVAETATEILEMEGTAMSLDKVKHIIESKINEVGGKEKLKTNARDFFEDIRNMTIQLFGKIFKALGKIIGVCLKIGAVMGVTTAIVFLLIAIMPFAYQNTGNMLNQINTLPYYHTLVILFFIAGVIPAAFLNNLGNVFFGKKIFKKTQVAITVFAIWIASLILGPVLFASVGNTYADKVESNIASSRVIENRQVQDFSKLTIKNGLTVTIVQGTTTSIEVRGSKDEIDKLVFTENPDSLTIERNNSDANFCFFCYSMRTEIFITTPDLKSLTAYNGSDIDVHTNTENLEVDQHNSSYVSLSGSAKNLDLTLTNASDIDASDFVATMAKVDIKNSSRAVVNVTGEITGSLTNASDLDQYGKGSTSKVKKQNGASRIERYDDVEEVSTSTTDTNDRNFEESETIEY